MLKKEDAQKLKPISCQVVTKKELKSRKKELDRLRKSDDKLVVEAKRKAREERAEIQPGNKI